jgi:hypothetical protein
VIDCWPELRVLRDGLEARDQPVIILVRRIHPEPADAPNMAALKVCIRRFLDFDRSGPTSSDCAPGRWRGIGWFWA